MSPKKTKDDSVMIRVETNMKLTLEKEAAADNRTLASYIRHLVDTHPARPANKKK